MNAIDINASIAVWRRQFFDMRLGRKQRESTSPSVMPKPIYVNLILIKTHKHYERQHTVSCIIRLSAKVIR